MKDWSRRDCLKILAASAALPGLAFAQGGPAEDNGALAQEWMGDWIRARPSTRTGASSVYLMRFRDPVFAVTQTITWVPDAPGSKLPKVVVPRGFVSDLKSLPRAFWTTLKPDSFYAMAGMLHGYLYWEQTVEREVADGVLKACLEELKAQPASVELIYRGTRLGGSSAWDENRRRKAAGEKRRLAELPEDYAVSWAEWRRRPEVFAED